MSNWTCARHLPGRHPVRRGQGAGDGNHRRTGAQQTRGIYAGAVGYLGFNGDMDLAIAIRTAVVKDQMLYVQAGARIVADSQTEAEWRKPATRRAR